MANFFVAITVAGVSGLCYLAILHPRVYRDKLMNFLLAADMIILIILGIYSMTITYTHTALIPMISLDKRTAADAAIDKIQIPFGWIILTAMTIVIFLYFLLWLSWELSKKSSTETDDSST